MLESIFSHFVTWQENRNEELFSETQLPSVENGLGTILSSRPGVASSQRHAESLRTLHSGIQITEDMKDSYIHAQSSLNSGTASNILKMFVQCEHKY